MKLLYIHGAPAAGKLTVAKAILEKIPGRLCDNHAAIDLARTVFDFGSDGFWSLVARFRFDVIEKAAEYGVPTLVLTSCYSHPEDYENFCAIEKAVLAGGGSLLPVYLECERQELGARVGNSDRRDRQKVTDEKDLDQFLGRWNIAPIPRSNCLKLRSDQSTVAETAERIIKHFQL